MNNATQQTIAAHHMVADHISAIRAALPVTHGLRLNLGDIRIDFRTNSEALTTKLHRYFNEFLTSDMTGDAEILVTAHECDTCSLPYELPDKFFVKEPDAGKTKIKEEWIDLPDGRIVRKRLTGMHFLFGDTGNAAIGTCLANDNQVVNFINNRFLEYKLNEGCVLGHAAGVMHNGRGISLAGFSGMGKSTLALHLMSKGATFISNDRVLVKSNADNLPTMYGIPKQPRINPGTALNNPDLRDVIAEEDRERFLALSTTELWNLEHKYDAIIEECYGRNRFILQAPMAGLVILNWSRNGDPLRVNQVDPRERRDLLPAFMKATGLFYRPASAGYTDPAEDVYAEVLSRTVLIEISGGVDFDAAAEACLKFMERGTL